MKKAIVLILALVLVVSSLASAMAFEAHKVNVKAHVENAIGIEMTEIDFETVFPQEWITGDDFVFEIELSKSFVDQKCTPRVDTVAYEIWASHKYVDAAWLPWLPGLYVKVGAGGWNAVTEPSTWDLSLTTSYTKVAMGSLGFDCDDQTTWYDCVYLGLDVPVFDGYYNGALEDAAGINKPRPDVAPFPADVNVPSGILTADASSTWDDTFLDCGVDLWIQVTGITDAGINDIPE